MRTWKAAQRAVLREAAHVIHRLDELDPLPLLLAIGRQRPQAVIAAGTVEVEEPEVTLNDLLFTAMAFQPTRIQVALVSANSSLRLTGMMVSCDARAVADGLVQTSSVRLWVRLGP